MLRDFRERRLASGGEYLEYFSGSLNGGDRSSGGISQDDNILTIALGFKIGSSSESSNDLEGVAGARKEICFHAQAKSRLIDGAESGRFHLISEDWGEVNLGVSEEVDAERRDGHDHGWLFVGVVACFAWFVASTSKL